MLVAAAIAGSCLSIFAHVPEETYDGGVTGDTIGALTSGWVDAAYACGVMTDRMVLSTAKPEIAARAFRRFLNSSVTDLIGAAHLCAYSAEVKAILSCLSWKIS